MISIIRFCLLFTLLFIIFLFLFRKYKKKSFGKWGDLGFNLIIVIAIVKISSLPFENLILKYDSPTEAFRYLGRGDYLGTEEGDISCLLITNENSERSYIYLEKKGEYLAAPFFEVKEKIVLGDRENGTSFTLIKEKNTNNYYVIVFTTKNTKNEYGLVLVTDNYNSEFHRQMYSDEVQNEYAYLYSAYVEDVDDEYRIYINDNEYIIY